MIKNNASISFASEMQSLQMGYVDQLKSMFPEIIQLKNALTQKNSDPAKIERLSRLVHTLSGLGTTVGFPMVSESGRKLSGLLLAGEKSPAGDNDVRHQELVRYLEEFEKACHQVILNETMSDKGNHVMETTSTSSESQSKIVCILAKEGRPLHDIDKQLQHFGYVVSCTSNVEEFKASVAHLNPHAIIAYSDMSSADVEMLKDLPQSENKRSYPPQIIIISSQDNFHARLAGVRIGAHGFFPENTDVIQIVDKIEQLVAKFSIPPTYHVLVVDDDDVQVRFYTHVLQTSGIMTTVIGEPHEALEVIANQSVDLVLMDFIMPECNGQELATIIRQHEKYVSLPIIFLSARDDLEQLLINTGLGIDDFLVKPVTGDQLVSVVKSRAQRSAELQVLMARDSFTGLHNHAHFMDMLAMELGQVKRFKTSTAYASIDIDHFKNINDTYGHVAGDHVIKSLSRMLQQRLRRSDIIGRCGGEEFGIIMPDCTLENASLIIESMRLQFAEMAFKMDNADVRVTFSAGLTALGQFDKLDDLIKAADKALYSAKNQGRNRLVVV